jgi:hypothetical protein
MYVLSVDSDMTIDGSRLFLATSGLAMPVLLLKSSWNKVKFNFVQNMRLS